MPATKAISPSWKGFLVRRAARTTPNRFRNREYASRPIRPRKLPASRPVRSPRPLSAWYTASLQEICMRVWQGVVVAAVAVPLLARAADTSLLDALRKNDVAAVRTVLAAGADSNTRDETGASARMYAAVYSSPDEMRLLIGKGADVNTANANGSTALMWAAGETAKVDLLLQHGADVSMKTRNGTTALIAAGNHGNEDVIRRLVARGADPKATNDIGIGLQSVALFRTD